MSSPSPRPNTESYPRTPAKADPAPRIIGDGEMAELIRAFDWSSTSLGPVETWPATLVTTVNMLLASRHPMFLWWGPDLIQFYNDGYRPCIRADKHPRAVGQRGTECWPEVWSIIGPQIESVMREGRSTWHVNQLVPINRDGKLEDVYWTYSYSPVRDDGGIIRGTLVVCSETTDQVLSERRLKTLVAVTATLKQAEEALQRANDDLEKKVAERTAALEAEVAERKRMEISLRELTGRLLATRDEERRHMARELHDNAGQILAALTMNLSAIEGDCGGADSRLGRMASEARQLSEDLNREIRTLSYLLHPPLLDEVGLESAIRWYVEGFSERSKIEVDLDLPTDSSRLPRELELVLFRVVQESLTNVHRHSGSPWARILLTRAEDRIAMEINDRGKGIPPEKHLEMTGAKVGVGVRGMQERVRQFGGTLQILSGAQGTTVIVNLPVESPSASDQSA